MPLLANLSIRNKIAGIILLTTVLALSSAFLLMYLTTVRIFEQHLLQTINLIARAAGDYCAVGLAFEDEQEAQTGIDKLREFPNILEAQLFTTEKEFFVAFSRDGSPSQRDAVLDADARVEGGFVHVFAPVRWRGATYGTIYVRASTAELTEQKKTLLVTMGVSLAGLVIAAVIFAYILQGLISKPILHLAAQAQHITHEGDYSVRVSKPGNDEIGLLYDGFNDMLAQIEARQLDLQRSNRDLDQFAYVASHDLKAPLRAISTLSAWLEEDLKGDLAEEAKEQLRLLRSRVHRMDSLIDGVLRYSRAGRMDMEGERVDVGELLHELVDLLDPPAGIQVTIAEDMPVLMTKRLRLSQVFSNLINNAIKYHHHREGQIEVSVDRLGPDLFEFAVRDDGPGIAPQHHQRVFVMFQTLQARDEVESTGLGLSLVKKLVEEEGGEVSLRSEPGHGSTFLFTWPAVEATDDGVSS